MHSKHAQTAVVALLGALLLAGDSHARESGEPGTRQVLLLAHAKAGERTPPDDHHYMAGMAVLANCLAQVPGLQVNVVAVDDPWTEGPDLIRQADGVVLYLAQGAKWIHEDPRRLEALAHLAARGGGCVAVHWGMGTTEQRYIDGFLKLFGGCHGGPELKSQVLNAEVRRATPGHEILRGVGDFSIRDGFYYQLKFVADAPTIQPILTTRIEVEAETIAWAWQRGDGGRSFGFSGAHFPETWERHEYRRLIAQAVLWSVKLPIPPQGLDIPMSNPGLDR